jgi:hypothetical protein
VISDRCDGQGLYDGRVVKMDRRDLEFSIKRDPSGEL